MFSPPPPAPSSEPASPSGTVRLDQPHDTCFRCGRPTPPGVSLCERDNPGRIKSPSSTQVHGTILIGVLAGFIGLLLILRLASSGIGPFTSTVSGYATRQDGGLDVVVSVQNGGNRASGASCRISPDGAPDYRDFVFFTAQIPAGESREFTQTVPAPSSRVPLQAGAISVRCS